MFQRIVIPIDLYKGNNWSELIYRLFNIVEPETAHLYIIYVVPEFGINLFDEYLSQEWFQQKKNEASVGIQQFITKFFPQEFIVEQYIARGIVVEEVINYADKVNADLIVLTCSKNLMSDQNSSYNTKKIVGQTNKSVLILRD